MQNINPRKRRMSRRFAMQAIYQWLLTGNEMDYISRQFTVDGGLVGTLIDLIAFSSKSFEHWQYFTNAECTSSQHTCKRVAITERIEST